MTSFKTAIVTKKKPATFRDGRNSSEYWKRKLFFLNRIFMIGGVYRMVWDYSLLR